MKYARGRQEICREILDDLPEWFGIASSKAAYGDASARIPMSCRGVGEDMAGFSSLRIVSAACIDLYVLGVRRAFHRRGVGSVLTAAAADFAAKGGRRYLAVKTLAHSNPHPYYARTRAFYEAVGFAPIDVFPEHRGAENLCLLMVEAV